MTTSCSDVTPSNNAECYGNVSWAMQTGIYQYPMWYTDYPALSITGNFKDFQNILASQKGMPGNCPLPCDYVVPKCYDVPENSPGQCHYNLLWAKNTGLATYPEWYSQFPGLRLNSTVSDFQYVLHSKLGPGNGTGWQCPMPCSSKLLDTATTAASTSTATKHWSMGPLDLMGLGFNSGSAHDVQGHGLSVGSARDSLPVDESGSTMISTTTNIESSSPSVPWWCLLLLVLLAGLLVVAAVAIAAGKKKRAPKNKKRSTDMRLQEEQPTPAAESILAPIQMQPVDVRVMPIPAAVPTAQPFQFFSVPAWIRTGPAYPVKGPPVPRDLFDQIDTNGDGVITREEYARLSLFDQLDTNRDGVLTQDELARLV